PAGPITYRFEIAAASSFGSLVAAATVPEGVNETGFIPTADLPANATLFWRATAIDAGNAVSSAPSAAQSFTTSLTIDLRRVVYLNSPDVSNWPQTATLFLVE